MGRFVLYTHTIFDLFRSFFPHFCCALYYLPSMIENNGALCEKKYLGYYILKSSLSLALHLKSVLRRNI